MKAFLTMIAVAIVVTAHAQTRTGQYEAIQTLHVETHTGALKSKLIAMKTGNIQVADKLVTIDLDADQSRRQVFTIVSRSEVQDYCYDDDPAAYGIQFLQTFYPFKDGLKYCRIVLLFAKDKKTITDVIVQKSKSSEVCYRFK